MGSKSARVRGTTVYSLNEQTRCANLLSATSNNPSSPWHDRHPWARHHLGPSMQLAGETLNNSGSGTHGGKRHTASKRLSKQHRDQVARHKWPALQLLQMQRKQIHGNLKPMCRNLKNQHTGLAVPRASGGGGSSTCCHPCANRN